MFAKVYSAATMGIDAYVVEVEVDIAEKGMPKLEMVGLPDTAVKESKERVRSAVTNTDLVFPGTRITFNLAPADNKKEGPAFDLPMAVGLIAAQGGVDTEKFKDLVFVGELALDGRLRPVSGVLPIALLVRDTPHLRGIVAPARQRGRGLACRQHRDISRADA